MWCCWRTMRSKEENNRKLNECITKSTSSLLQVDKQLNYTDECLLIKSTRPALSCLFTIYNQQLNLFNIHLISLFSQFQWFKLQFNSHHQCISTTKVLNYSHQFHFTAKSMYLMKHKEKFISKIRLHIEPR
jgi:hypothetical protein